MRLLLPSMVAVLLAACDGDWKSPLNSSDIFLGKRLSSVSADPYSADRFFIGTEDGNIFVYNGATGSVDTLLTSFDRIYKVLPDSLPNGLRYWVGTRNRGLYLCSLRADSLHAERHYVLPVAEDKDSYSAYDICVARSGVYVATSNGLLKVGGSALKPADSNVLASVFVMKSGNRLQPMTVSDLRYCGEGTILCASDYGLLKIDERTGNVNVLLHRKINSIDLHGNYVVALVEGDTLISIDSRGKRLASVPLPHYAQRYYYDGQNAMNYLLSEGRVQLFRDAEFSQPDVWHQMDAGMPVPVNGHNVILPDYRRHQSLLVGKYSLRRVANHQDVFNSAGEVRLACADGDKIYYLVGTHLFRQLAGSDEAVQLKDISGGTGDVRHMQVAGDTLYYVDSACKAYKAFLYSSYFENAFLSYDHLVEPRLSREATAMGTDGSRVYVGVRDGIVSLCRADSMLLGKVYASRFASCCGTMAFSTLNDGVFTGRGGVFKRIAGSEKFPFVRDVAFASAGNGSKSTLLYVLTNHSLLMSRDGGSLSLVRPLTGYRRLLAAGDGQLYGVADFGIDNLADSVRLLSDVHFEPEACVAVGGKIYAASTSGVYVFGGAKGKDGGYSMVRFVTKSLYTPMNIFLLVLAVSLLVALVWWRDRCRRRNETLAAMQLRLRARVDELCKVSSMLDDDLRQLIDEWKGEIWEISRLKTDEISRRVDILNKDIQQATFRVPAILSRNIERQIEELETHRSALGCDRLISDSRKARSGGDVAEMADVLAANARWLRQLSDDEALVESVSAVFSGLADVPNVSDEINKVLKSDESPAEKLGRLRCFVGDGGEKGDSASGISMSDQLKRRLSSPQAVAEIKKYAVAQYDVFKCWRDETPSCSADPLFEEICAALSADYEAVSAILNGIRPDVQESLRKLRLAGCRRDMLVAIAGVKSKIGVFFDVRKEMLRKGADEKTIRERLAPLVSGLFERGTMVDDVKAFYAVADKSQDKCLFSKIGLKRKKGDALSLSEIILVLLMANSGKKVSAFSAITNVNNPESGKQHLRKLRRDIAGAVGGCKDFLEGYAEENKSSFASLLLALCVAADADN